MKASNKIQCYSDDDLEPPFTPCQYNNTNILSSSSTQCATRILACLQCGSIALFRDGSAATWGCWGEAHGEEVVRICQDNNIVHVNAGQDHVILVSDTNKMFGVGMNDLGQIDNIPKDATHVACGEEHTAYVLANGDIKVQGYYNFQTSTPGGFKKVYSGDDIIIGIRKNNTMSVLKYDGRFFDEDIQRLFNVDTCVSPALAEMLGLKSDHASNLYKKISIKDHLVVLDSHGHVTAIGRNDYNQCDLPESITERNIVDVGATKYTTYIMYDDNTVQGYGKDNNLYTGVKNIGYGVDHILVEHI